MSTTLETITIDLDNDCSLEVSGHYEREIEPIYYPVDKAEPGQGASFEIIQAIQVKGNAMDLIIAIDALTTDAVEYIQEQCINKLNG